MADRIDINQTVRGELTSEAARELAATRQAASDLKSSLGTLVSGPAGIANARKLFESSGELKNTRGLLESVKTLPAIASLFVVDFGARLFQGVTNYDYSGLREDIQYTDLRKFGDSVVSKTYGFARKIPGIGPIAELTVSGYNRLFGPSQASIDSLSPAELAEHNAKTGLSLQYSKQKVALEAQYEALKLGIQVAEQLEKSVLQELSDSVLSGNANPELSKGAERYIQLLREGSISHYRTVASTRVAMNEMRVE